MEIDLKVKISLRVEEVNLSHRNGGTIAGNPGLRS
jgi:hypothetical protein